MKVLTLKRLCIACAVLILTATVLCSLFAPAASAATAVTRVAVRCDLFAAPDPTSAIKTTIPQNAAITYVNQGTPVFYGSLAMVEVTYGTVSGFIAARNVCVTDKVIGTQSKTVKITTSEIGVDVEVKQYPMQSDTLAVLKDGTSVEKVEGGVEYGEYTEIVYGDGRAFVRTENLTDGLTYYQTIAIIIGVVAFCLVVLMVALLVYGKKIHNQTR